MESNRQSIIRAAPFSDRELAETYLQRLALGDKSVLAALGGLEIALGKNGVAGLDTQSHEWGLGRDIEEQRYILVLADTDAVDWTSVPGLKPVAHSHPYEPGFVAGKTPTGGNTELDVPFTEGIKLVELLRWAESPDAFVDAAPPLTRILPSNQDVRANYLVDGGPENLYLPYRFDPVKGVLSVDSRHPPLVVTFGPVSATLAQPLPADLDNHAVVYRSFYTGVRVRAGDTEIWTGWLSVAWGELGAALGQAPPAEARIKAENDKTLYPPVQRRRGYAISIVPPPGHGSPHDT